MQNEIPLIDCPIDYIFGEASGKVLNEYMRFPCKIKCGVYAFMAAGTARATVNITQYEFQENDVLYLSPNSFFRVHEFSEDARVLYIVLSSSFLEKNAYSIRRPRLTGMEACQIVHVTPEQKNVILHFSQVLEEAVNCTPSMIDTERMVHVYNLIHLIFHDYFVANSGTKSRPMDRKSEIFQEYSELVMKHYKEWHHVAEYATAMHITVPHLCSTIKQASSRTAGDLIIEAIITDAKAQLKLSIAPIKEIGLSLGFDNVAFFNRFFKTHTGITPKNYRNGED
ncbi:MAG: AraC family transcriptional regulator [Paludibacteraceae bacterium]|nr:AraC family transcriptional regulator [Paludibacteraceae bacterium]